MVRIPEMFFINKDVRAFRKRMAFLVERVASRDVNAGGSGYDRAEIAALKRLLSQVDDSATPCDPVTPKDSAKETYEWD